MGSGTAGMLTPGGACIVPFRRPTANVRALIFVRVDLDVVVVLLVLVAEVESVVVIEV